MIRAVIFDMDGVLIDAKEWHYEALNQALAKFGYLISRHDHLVAYDGLPTKKKLEMLSIQEGLPTSIHGFLNELKQKYTLSMVEANCAPNFSHQYALSQLKREGKSIVVASNSVRDSVRKMMEKAKLIAYLDFYLSNEDVANGKPSPEIYLKAMSKLKVPAHQCVIVEDNPNGIAAAKASGAHVMEVETVDDVNYGNISRFISAVEKRQ